MIGGIKKACRCVHSAKKEMSLYGSSCHIYLYTFIENIRSCGNKNKTGRNDFSFMRSSEFVNKTKYTNMLNRKHLRMIVAFLVFL